MGGRGTATLSAFTIEKTNVLNSLGGGVSVLTGAEESHGFEFELNASITDALQIIAGYAFVDAKVKSDLNTALIGQELRNAPEHTASIWGRYEVNDRLGIGMGVNYVSDRAGELPRTGARIQMPSYIVADLVFYYDHPKVYTTLKFGNIFDEEYFESGFTDLRIQPGAPASVVLSFTRNF